MGNPTTPSPGAGYTWITTSSGDNPTEDGYWQAPADPNAAANYEAGKAASTWKLPMAPGASYFEAGTGNPWVTPGLQRSMNEFFSTPTSGYGAYMAPGGANYGAELGRWQFSNSAPVPQTAPRGWGRYPGQGGGLPSAGWVTNPTAGGVPPQTPNPYQLKLNPMTNNNGGGGGVPPATVTPPQQPPTGGGSPYQPPGGGAYPPGFTPGTTPPSTQGWMPGPATQQVSQNSLSGFRFQNAAPGSVEANFNAIQAKHGPQDAISYLMLYGNNGGQRHQFENALQAGGMSSADVSRIINQFSAGGSGGQFNNGLAGFNGGVFSNGTDVGGLLKSIGVQDTSARDALAAFNAQRAARMAKIRG
jgi:hypothetical protein